jgi:GalNAc-alpha-(1->4)-GalNAc-alpha-(1->3)-diNAcBac-PP-undecaprenol alpha-1,4-N-acetyl-D-galactosaminyltransferase
MKKKIAFIIPCLSYGGAERVIVSLANKFTSNFEVFLIVFYKSDMIYNVDEKVNIVYLQEKYTASFSFIDAIINNIGYLKKLIKIAKKNKIDALIGFTTSVNIITVISSFYLKTPTLISERNNPEVYIPNFFWKVLRKFSYSFTSGLVVQTDFIKRFYQKTIQTDKIIIIPNPIDEYLISKRKFYGDRLNIILTVGRLDENKNQRLLIEAFSNLNPENWKLIIVGDGILRDVYKKLVKDLDIEQKVEFVGNVQNVWDYYNQAKIFAFTSNSEGFPNALLEAMSFGLPCISTDCPSGPSEIIINDENGYLIEVNNRKQLEDRLSKLINNPAICDQFSQNAISTTLKFNMVEVKKLWEVQIQKLL